MCIDSMIPIISIEIPRSVDTSYRPQPTRSSLPSQPLYHIAEMPPQLQPCVLESLLPRTDGHQPVWLRPPTPRCWPGIVPVAEPRPRGSTSSWNTRSWPPPAMGFSQQSRTLTLQSKHLLPRTPVLMSPAYQPRSPFAEQDWDSDERSATGVRRLAPIWTT